ncbi:MULTISPECIES: transposase [unclassified Nocardia]|uniref:transposase n=1 Tax=unclassified Nocardia TaxID=2637762 RepID=UPI001CE474E3|nr:MULTISPECIES: transposase [unclassified Nocardia]
MTGPNPTDRGKPGSKLHVLSDRTGIPVAIAISAADVHDSQRYDRDADRVAQTGQAARGKDYDQSELRQWVRRRGIAVRIVRKDIESTEHLGRRRWVIERAVSWLTSYHRLNIRYDRKGIHYLGFLRLRAALTASRN